MILFPNEFDIHVPEVPQGPGNSPRPVGTGRPEVPIAIRTSTDQEIKES